MLWLRLGTQRSRYVGSGHRVQNWSVFKFCSRPGRLSKARWRAKMFLTGWSKMMNDRRGLHHDTDVGSRERRWSLVHQCCTETVRLDRPFDVLLMRHDELAAYGSRIYALFRRYHWSST